MTKEEALKILGIKSAHPSEKDLKLAYRYKQFILHPDRLPPNASDEMRQRAGDELKLVNEAYSIILNLLNGNEEEIRPPRLHVAPSSIRFKDMAPGQIKSTTLEIKSVGGPYTKAWIEFLPMPWLNIAPRTSLSSIHLPAQIRIEALGIQQGDPRSSCQLKVKMINESTGQLDEVKVNIERLSQAQTPTPKPKPIVTPSYIRFDNVDPAETKTSSFTIQNAGGPYSKLGFTRPNSWLKVVRWSSLSTSDELPLKVNVEGVGTDWDKTYTESITVNLDQEETTVKVELITKPFSNNGPNSNPSGTPSSTSSHTGSWLVGILASVLVVIIVLVLGHSNNLPGQRKTSIPAVTTSEPSPTPVATAPTYVSTPIQYGQEVSGNIEKGNSQDWKFNGQQGDIITVRMIQDGGASLEPVLDIYDPSGSRVFHDWSSPEVRCQNYTLRFSGTYTIRASGGSTTFSSSTTGGYRLNLALKPPAGSLAYGQQVNSAIALPNDYQDWKFNGQQGDIITVRMIQDGSTSLEPVLDIYDPSGSRVFHDWSSPEVRCQNYTLRFSGTYTIRASGGSTTFSSSTTGGYKLLLSKN